MTTQFDTQALIDECAPLFHADWRVNQWGKKKGNHLLTPRWKRTFDEDWAEENDGKHFCEYNQNGEPEVNINIDFDRLPEDWQRDNQEAAESAIPIAIAAFEAGTLDGEGYLDDAGDQIHEAWRERRRETEADDENFKKLDVPFADLEDWAKDQDRNFAAIARMLVKQAASK